MLESDSDLGNWNLEFGTEKVKIGKLGFEIWDLGKVKLRN